MTKNDIKLIVEIGAVIGWVGTLAYSISANLKLNKVAAKLDIAVDDMIESNQIEIPTDMIERSVVKIAERKYDMAIRNACDEAVTRTRNDFDNRIKVAVADEFNIQKAEVAKEMKRKINSIDISAIRREVVEEAKETAAEKFKSDLDDILAKHNEELDNVSTIYASIAEKLSGK